MAIQNVDGYRTDDERNITLQEATLEPNVRHVSVMQVRTNSVRAWLDGRLMAEVDPTKHLLSMYPYWSLKDETRLALGVKGTAQFFRFKFWKSPAKAPSPAPVNRVFFFRKETSMPLAVVGRSELEPLLLQRLAHFANQVTMRPILTEFHGVNAESQLAKPSG